MRPMVIKLGGSLAAFADLRALLSLLAGQTRRSVLLVPGGGLFADAVRAAQGVQPFNDGTAHRMALLAMDQYGLMLRGLAPSLGLAVDAESVARAAVTAKTTIWLPSRHITGHPAIAESWNVTADSLAAWLAGEINAAHLLLIKAAALPPLDAPLAAWQQAGIIDAAFADFAARGGFTVSALNADRWRDLADLDSCGSRMISR